MDNRNNIGTKLNNNRKIIIIILILVLILIITCLTIIFTILKQNNNTIKVARISTNETDKIISDQIESFPKNIYKNKITLKDGMEIDSKKINKNSKLNYSVKVFENNSVYNYQFIFDDKKNLNYSYNLFSTAKSDMLIGNFYEIKDGYLLIVYKNIECNEAICDNYDYFDKNNIEIQKYNKKNQLEWFYEINTEDNSKQKIEKYYYNNNKHYFYYNNRILILNNEGKKIKELELEKYNIDYNLNINYYSKNSNNIFYKTQNNKINIIDLVNLKISDNWKFKNNFIYFGYSDGYIYSYRDFEYDYDKERMKKSDRSSKEIYGIIHKEKDGNEKTVNVREDYDKSYKTNNTSNYYYSDPIFNNGYTYISLMDNGADGNHESLSKIAIMIYDKDLKLVKTIDLKDKEIKLEGKKYNHNSRNNDLDTSVIVENNNMYILTNLKDENLVIEKYNNNGKKYYDTVVKDYNNICEFSDMRQINNKELTCNNSFNYKNTNYFQVTKIKIDK